MIAVRKNLVAEEVDMVDVSAAVLWVAFFPSICNPLHVGSFYRQPRQRSTHQLDELEKSLNFISNQTQNKYNFTSCGVISILVILTGKILQYPPIPQLKV